MNTQKQEQKYHFRPFEFVLDPITVFNASLPSSISKARRSRDYYLRFVLSVTTHTVSRAPASASSRFAEPIETRRRASSHFRGSHTYRRYAETFR